MAEDAVPLCQHKASAHHGTGRIRFPGCDVIVVVERTHRKFSSVWRQQHARCPRSRQRLDLLTLGTGSSNGEAFLHPVRRACAAGLKERRFAFTMLRSRLPVKVQRHVINPEVEDAHDDQRYPEVSDLEQAVEDRILHVLDVALARWHRSFADEVLPAEDRREKDERRYDPGQRDHCGDPRLGPPVPVGGRDADGAESVDGDAEDRVDGAQADRVVDGQPEVAHELAQRPALPGQHVDGVEGHGQAADQEVAGGQRCDEAVVRLTADGPVDEEGQQDDQVAGDGGHRREAGEEPEAGYLPGRVRIADTHRRFGYVARQTSGRTRDVVALKRQCYRRGCDVRRNGIRNVCDDVCDR